MIVLIFIVYVERKLQNCLFDFDMCDWVNSCSLSGNDIGWLRRSGPSTTHGTGPQAAHGGSGMG